MNPALNASRFASPIVELRQYTLKPGQRETLIALFDREFVETQEATGMTVIGQFRDLDRPDMFVWLRGFEDMTARKNALTAFYDGPVWAAHKDAANATMIDSDDVLLLKPAWRGAEFDLRPAAAEAKSMSDDRRLPGFVEISIHHLQPGTEASFAERFRTETLPQMTDGAQVLAAFITERAENTFPRLPVRAGETVFVAVTAAAGAAAPRGPSEYAAPEVTRTQTLRLAPTRRSLLG
ncbi:NIPSNAP family protein [Mesorhizobium sp.]|uniref:NIPSNAP family protein n=1 Tax=Mesorhizobium sp. TaxID=1871066 RepID=UPI0025FCE01A|nr:NIPSNAP family protein [Mesorhizobium sp.]